MCLLVCIHPFKILKKYCTCERKHKVNTHERKTPEIHTTYPQFKCYVNCQPVRRLWYRNSDTVKVHRANAPLHKPFYWLLLSQSWENGSSFSHQLMVNKEAFVPAADQEFSWTMTLDGSDPLPTKQWFCFKFRCQSCSPQNQCDLRLPRPTERSHETRLKTRLHRVGGFVLGWARGSYLCKCWEDNEQTCV